MACLLQVGRDPMQYFMVMEKDPCPMLICATEMRSLVRLKPQVRLTTQSTTLISALVMDARPAADFWRVSESEFKRMEPRLPRHAVIERRFIYHRSELLAWLLGRK